MSAIPQNLTPMTHGLKSQIGLCTRAQYALIGVTAVIVLLFYFAGYRSQTSRLHSLMQEITQSQQDLMANQTQASRLPIVTADIARLRNQLADFKKLPDSLELGEFVTQITQISRLTDMHSLEYSLAGAPRPHEQFAEQPVQLKFEGDFRNVFTFVRQVEDLQRLIRITNIVIHGQDVKDGLVHVDMSLNLYYSEG